MKKRILLSIVCCSFMAFAADDGPSADEIAAELSNPNTALASLNFKNQFILYDGDLTDADDQGNYKLLFQPVLPFPRVDGSKIIFRPAVPVLVEQPVFDGNRFIDTTGLGDIAFDLAYASPPRDDGIILAVGLIASLPTATDDLGTDRWSAGPEFLMGKVSPTQVYGIFPSHQWDYAGSGDARVNLTSIQYFYTHLPGGGYSVGTGPTVTYDWEGDQWTVPFQINASKTVTLRGQPWKIGVEANYYAERTDAFASDWLFGINITPVVKNPFARLF